MFAFVFGLVLLAGAAAVIVALKRAVRKAVVRFAIAGFMVFVALLAIVGSVTATVGTKNVGVLTTFGRPTGYLTNGFHLKAPWQSVTELDNAIQTNTYASDGGDAGHQQNGAIGTCVHVRIARQGTGCANVTVRWQIKPAAVDYLFRNYTDNDAIRDNLVLRNLQIAMNDAFADYDPLGIDSNGLSTNKPLDQISAKVLEQMVAHTRDWVDVSTVAIPILNFDGTTQDKINQLQQQVAATRVAQQAIVTAQSQAAANAALAGSVSNNPGVLTDKCLNILKEAIEKGQALPAGFSCFGPTSTSVAVK